MNTIVEVEMVMFEIENLFYNISFIDIIAYAINIVLLIHVDCISVCILYFLHFARSVLGLIIWWKMPKARELIKVIKSNLDCERALRELNVPDIKENVVLSVDISLESQFRKVTE